MKFSLNNGANAGERDPATPINILVAGNFSGSGPESDSQGSGQSSVRLLELDPFDIDAAMALLHPRVLLGEEGARIGLVFSEIDHFHPDALYHSVEAFATLRELKQALDNPSRAGQAAAVVSQLTGIDIPQGDPAAAEPAPQPADEELLSRLLGSSRGGSTVASSAMERLLADVVQGEVSAPVPAHIEQMRAALVSLEQDAMRDLLRDPGFRAVESSWRSLIWLTQQLDAEEEWRIWLFDTGYQQPAQWVETALAEIGRALFDTSLAVITVLSDCAEDDNGRVQLEALAALGQACNCPVLAGAGPGLAGLSGTPGRDHLLDSSDLEAEPAAWLPALRESVGASLGLGFPRILLRQPYGRRSDPVDAFDFEELASNPDHQDFLWGSAAGLLTAAWLGRCLGDPDALVWDDLPSVVYDDGSGQAIKPPSEFYLSDSAADAVASRGIIPLRSVRGEARVVLRELPALGGGELFA